MTLPRIFVYKRERFLTRAERRKLCSSLVPEGKNKINRFKNRSDAENFLIAKVMQRNLIASLIGSAPKKLIFGVNKYGRPYLKSPRVKNLDFNISHSGDCIAVAVADCPIGIDVERIKPLDIKIAAACFTEQELKYLGSRRGKQLEKFYKIWVLKESFVKAAGKGLSFPLKGVNFKYNRGGNTVLKLKYLNKKWFFRIYRIDKNYKMAICSYKNRFPQKINFMNKSLVPVT